MSNLTGLGRSPYLSRLITRQTLTALGNSYPVFVDLFFNDRVEYRFPSTGIIDNFNRADGGIGSGWTADPYGVGSAGLNIASNQARSTGASYQESYRTTPTYGPDVEGYLTITTVGGNGQEIAIGIRLQSPGTAGVDAYYILLTFATGTDTVQIYRVDNQAGTLLGATINQEFLVGDKLGVLMIGSTVYVLHKKLSGGNWYVLGSRTDSTYSSAGYLALTIENTTIRVDDFGGGPVAKFALLSQFLARSPFGSVTAVLNLAVPLSRFVGRGVFRSLTPTQNLNVPLSRFSARDRVYPPTALGTLTAGLTRYTQKSIFNLIDVQMAAGAQTPAIAQFIGRGVFGGVSASLSLTVPTSRFTGRSVFGSITAALLLSAALARFTGRAGFGGVSATSTLSAALARFVGRGVFNQLTITLLLTAGLTRWGYKSVFPTPTALIQLTALLSRFTGRGVFNSLTVHPTLSAALGSFTGRGVLFVVEARNGGVSAFLTLFTGRDTFGTHTPTMSLTVTPSTMVGRSRVFPPVVALAAQTPTLTRFHGVSRFNDLEAIESALYAVLSRFTGLPAITPPDATPSLSVPVLPFEGEPYFGAINAIESGLNVGVGVVVGQGVFYPPTVDTGAIVPTLPMIIGGGRVFPLRVLYIPLLGEVDLQEIYEEPPYTWIDGEPVFEMIQHTPPTEVEQEPALIQIFEED